MRRANRSWIALALLTAACGSGRLEPVPLPLDRASCAACGMLISDARTAAQAVLPDADPRFYDDIGCVASDRSLPEAQAQVYVSNGSGGGWIRAETAYFARVPDLRTPMGYGIAAFRTQPLAQASDREGRARTWSDLRSDFLRGGVR